MVTLKASRTESVASNRGSEPQEDASEFYHYADSGCEASDSCLDCPLPRCRYDDPLWYQRNRRLARDLRIIHTMQRESLTVKEAAARFSVTPRTLLRIMQRCREATRQADVSDGLVLAA